MKRAFALFFAVISMMTVVCAATASEDRFIDVPTGSWYEQGIMTCSQNGIMVGTEEHTFSPDAVLTQAECVMLAYRLYDVAHGGDGSVMKAPENHGYMKLVADDGKVIREGYGGDRSIWTISTYLYSTPYGLRLCLPGGGEGDPGDVKGTDATLTLDGVDYPGKLVWSWQSHQYYLVFVPEDETVNELLLNAAHSSLPEQWWADLAYTIEQKGLGSLYPSYFLTDNEADRGDFAELLGQSTELSKRLEITSIPDGRPQGFSTRYDCIRKLYEAGVIGGVDVYGTFDSTKSLTRAEAAIMVARVLDESQRLTVPPKPMPKAGDGYTLTYLMDGEIDIFFRQDTYPYFFVADPTPEDWQQRKGFLKLDGSFTPWPESETPYMIDRYGGDNIFLTYVYKPENKDELNQYKAGVLNGNMEWLIEPQYKALRPREGGYVAFTVDDRRLLLDEKGQQVGVVTSEDELPPIPPWPGDGGEYWEEWQNWGGLWISDEKFIEGQCYYRWPDGSPATEWFDQCGNIGPEGQGFVQKNGKIYRIAFEK